MIKKILSIKFFSTFTFVLHTCTGVFDDLAESEATNKIASQRLEVFVQSGGNLDILLTVHGPLDSEAVFSVYMKSFLFMVILKRIITSYNRVLLRIL